jgi:hypothetical protein
MRFVKSMKYLTGHKLLLIFDNDRMKMVDLRRHIDGEIFEPLKDIAYFRKVRLDPEMETITWENEADFAPEFLYEIGVDVPKHRQRRSEPKNAGGRGRTRSRRATGSRLRATQAAKR